MRRLCQAVLTAAVLAGSLGCQAAGPRLAVVPETQMRFDAARSTITSTEEGWNLRLRVADDNNDATLPSNFRRWYHAEVDGLTGEARQLNVTIENAGWRGGITPVWSLDGGKSYSRVPASGDGLAFTLTVPAGTESLRLAKWYPYTMADHERWRTGVVGSPLVTESVLGNSAEGRPIRRHRFTAPTGTTAGRKGVWITSAVHPAENNAYFMVEGLTAWLTSDAPEAKALAAGAIIDIVMMANPDGVAHGNYRTTAESVNMELEWGAPYDSAVPEVAALRRGIEQVMGTAEARGANPLAVYLNLHAAHSGRGPFHFLHAGGWPDGAVTDAVRDRELAWIAALKSRSVMMKTARESGSQLGDRRYVEAMLHDRYSVHPAWDDVMAITFEGTYQYHPDGRPCTPDDYRQLGRDMGLALFDYLGLTAAAQP